MDDHDRAPTEVVRRPDEEKPASVIIYRCEALLDRLRALSCRIQMRVAEADRNRRVRE